MRSGLFQMNLPFLMSPRNTAIRAKVVEDWAQDGGVLLMGYEMYRLLSTKKSFVAGRKKKRRLIREVATAIKQYGDGWAWSGIASG